MKIDRLLGILTQLLERKSVTAPELARRFEVSRRTIIRDIEDLDRAGFPIVTRQGSGGGISLMEGFHFDRKILRRDEMMQVITGLQGLSSVSSNSRIDDLIKRLTSGMEHSITIDLSSFYKESLSEKIELFNKAMKDRITVRFRYYSPSGEEEREAEPLKIHYRWSDWYLFAYCLKRRDFRMFKLSRLWYPELTGSSFESRHIPEDIKEPGSHLKDDILLEVLFDKSVKHLIVESYGPSSFTERDDGKLLFRRGFTNRDYMISWLLQFGDQAVVIKPEALAGEIKRIASNIVDSYDRIL